MSGAGGCYSPARTRRSPFRYFRTSPEIIRLAVMLYVRFKLSVRNVEDLLRKRGIDFSRETVRPWRQRVGRMFAVEIRRKSGGMRFTPLAEAPRRGVRASSHPSDTMAPRLERYRQRTEIIPPSA